MLIISMKELPKSEQHSHAHKLLREALKPFGVDYNENTPLTFGELGKPSLTEYPEIRYNLSHSDGIAACIVGPDECGIDAEKVRDYRPNVVKRVFSDSERAMIDAVDSSEEKNLLFFRLWTLKESYVKAIGIGVSYPMKTVEFSFDGNKISSNIKDYSFKQYILKNGKFIVSTCEANNSVVSL